MLSVEYLLPVYQYVAELLCRRGTCKSARGSVCNLYGVHDNMSRVNSTTLVQHVCGLRCHDDWLRNSAEKGLPMGKKRLASV